jgi:RNA recognition motif-containing protein
MGTKLFVGNLSYGTTSADLEAHFRQIGETTSAQVITDRESGRSRGFGFVEMASNEDAQRAVSELDGKELQGRTINVSEARERAPREGGGGGGRGRGGFGGDRGGFAGGGGGGGGGGGRGERRGGFGGRSRF